MIFKNIMLKSLKFFRKFEQRYLNLNKKISYLKNLIEILNITIDNTTILLNNMFNKIVAKEYYQIQKFQLNQNFQARKKEPE